MRCYRCGLESPDNARFCPGCGTLFAANAQPAQPTYQQSAYQQPAYQQPAYQQPAYQQPASNTNKLILWIIIGVIVAAGIGVGLFFLLRGNDGDSSSNGGGSAGLTASEVSGTYYIESVNGKSVNNYVIEMYAQYGYNEAQAIADMKSGNIDPNNLDNSVYLQLNDDGTARIGGELVSMVAAGSTSGVWKLEGGNTVTLEMNGEKATVAYNNGKLTDVSNGNTVVYSKRG